MLQVRQQSVSKFSKFFQIPRPDDQSSRNDKSLDNGIFIPIQIFRYILGTIGIVWLQPVLQTVIAYACVHETR